MLQNLIRAKRFNSLIYKKACRARMREKS